MSYDSQNAEEYERENGPDDEPECLAGPHCTGCGLKNCPVNERGELK